MWPWVSVLRLQVAVLYMTCDDLRSDVWRRGSGRFGWRPRTLKAGWHFCLKYVQVCIQSGGCSDRSITGRPVPDACYPDLCLRPATQTCARGLLPSLCLSAYFSLFLCRVLQTNFHASQGRSPLKSGG